MKTLLLIVAFFSCAIIPTWCFNFSFPIFYQENTTLFKFSENAIIQLNAIQVTPDVSNDSISNKHGRAVYKDPFDIRNGNKAATFNTTFELKIGPKTSPGGEGMAFILTSDSSTPDGSEGQWMGIVNASTNGTPEAKIVAIEFDTRKNFPQDIDNNHVGLNVNSVNSIVQQPLSEFGINISTHVSFYVFIDYDGENISVFVSMSNKSIEDLTKTRVIFHPLDLSSIFSEPVFVGFSASTSNFTQTNCVRSWNFNIEMVEPKQSKRLWPWFTGGGMIFICGVVGLVFFYWKKKYGLNHRNEPYGLGGIEDQMKDRSIAPRARKFKLRELKKATGNFDPRNRLGKGGFGTVYRGSLTNEEVAIKRISKDSRQGEQEFIAEIATIGSLHHKNLVRLIGWCYEKRDLLLVYEYMPNSSLDKLIFGAMEVAPNWEIRHNIICGVAEALDYLHNGCEKTVLHRDVKSSNIMLDSNFEPKLGDFGLARMIRRTDQTHHSTKEIAGTLGYMAPEIFLSSRATAEMDIYAFGILILEVVCAKQPANGFELNGYDGSLAHWVWEFHKEGKIVEVVDRRIEGQFIKEEMEYLLILGLACCQPNPLQRPTIRNVLQVLKQEADPPILPNERPSFVWPPMPPSFEYNPPNSMSENHLNQFTQLTGR